MRGRYEKMAGVGYQGGSAIRDERNINSLLQALQENRCLFPKIPGAIARQCCLDAVMHQELLGGVRIFRSDNAYLAENSNGTDGDIVRMSDRYGHHIEGSCPIDWTHRSL